MKQSTKLKIVNPLLALLLLNQVLTALFSDFIPHEAYETIHGGGGFALTIVAVLHLIFNWNWVKANFLKKRPASGS